MPNNHSLGVPMITWTAIKAINFYQKFISPYKGFSCAHRVATNEVGCSGYGKKVIGRYGIIKGIKLLNRRFYDCSWHAANLNMIRAKNARESTPLSPNEQYKVYRPVGRRVTQGGFIDCDIPDCSFLGCDIPDFGIPDIECGGERLGDKFSCCDFADCGSCPDKKTLSEKFKNKRNSRNKILYSDEENLAVAGSLISLENTQGQKFDDNYYKDRARTKSNEKARERNNYGGRSTYGDYSYDSTPERGCGGDGNSWGSDSGGGDGGGGDGGD